MKSTATRVPALLVMFIAAAALGAGTLKSCNTLPGQIHVNAAPSRFNVQIKNDTPLVTARWALQFPNYAIEFVDACNGGFVSFAPEVAAHGCYTDVHYTNPGQTNDLTVFIYNCSPGLPTGTDFRTLFSPCYQPVGVLGAESLVAGCVATNMDCSFAASETNVVP